MKSTVADIHTPTPENPIKIEILIEELDDIRVLWHRLNLFPFSVAEVARNTDVMPYPEGNDHTGQLFWNINTIVDVLGIRTG